MKNVCTIFSLLTITVALVVNNVSIAHISQNGRSAFKTQRKRYMGRHSCRKEDNKDPKETDINAKNGNDSAQDMDCWRVFVNAALNLCIP